MGAEMGLWAVKDLVVANGVDEFTVLEVLRARIHDLGDATIAGLVDQQWIYELDDAEGIIAALTGGSDTYRAAAIAQLKEAIMVAATDVFCGPPSRDRCRFRDSAERTWIMSGGMSWGDAPTESCHTLEMLAMIAISADLIEAP